MLISPSYGHAIKTADHRTHQTIRGLSDRLGVEITADLFPIHGRRARLALPGRLAAIGAAASPALSLVVPGK
jgi:hypothetical protein